MKLFRVALAALIAASALTVIPASPVRAQGGSVAPMGGGPDPLGLSATQKQKIQAITMKAMAEATPVMQNKALTEAQKMEKLKAINKKYEPQVMALLTPAQRAKAKQLEAQVAKMAAGMQSYERSLTPTQKSKIEAINKGIRAEGDKIQADKKLTPQQKGDKLSALMKKRDQQIEAVLTPAQRAQRNKLKADADAQMRKALAARDAVLKTLTPDQKLRLQKIDDKFQAQAMAVMNDKKLTNEQEAAKMRALGQQRMKDRKAVLTPQQFQVLGS